MDLQTTAAAASGFLTSAALIIAIGAQNAFVLRQGIRRQHVLAVVLTCALSDALLISLGIAGFGAAVRSNPGALIVARYGGAAFLFAYGARAAWRAWHGTDALAVGEESSPSLRTALASCLAFTYLNPHCWLDTVVLVGSIASQQANPAARIAFGIGATCASVTWFFALGYGARLLRPIFARPVAWRLLDAAIAVVMWAIAGTLLRSG